MRSAETEGATHHGVGADDQELDGRCLFDCFFDAAVASKARRDFLASVTRCESALTPAYAHGFLCFVMNSRNTIDFGMNK